MHENGNTTEDKSCVLATVLLLLGIFVVQRCQVNDY